MKDFMSVCEIGRLFNLSVQTLHYYDTIDLFKPAYRDAQNGYRKYRFDQIYQLASIQYLKKLGYSLDQVKAYLGSRSLTNTLEILKERSRYLHAQWQELIQIDNAIQRKILFVERKLAHLEREKIEVRWFPERRYLPIGLEEELYNRDSFYFYPTIAFYEDGLKYFGALLDVAADGVSPESERLPVEQTAILPAGMYLVGYHTGPYEDIGDTFDAMRRAGAELPLSARAVNFNIIDQFVESDPQNYLTEVQMPLGDSARDGGSGGCLREKGGRRDGAIRLRFG